MAAIATSEILVIFDAVDRAVAYEINVNEALNFTSVQSITLTSADEINGKILEVIRGLEADAAYDVIVTVEAETINNITLQSPPKLAFVVTGTSWESNKKFYFYPKERRKNISK